MKDLRVGCILSVIIFTFPTSALPSITLAFTKPLFLDAILMR